jgi:hypothetical protein
LTERDVHEEAERLVEQHGLPELPDESPESIPVEVLGQLELLNHQLITTDDIPALTRFLQTAPGKEAEGWATWHEYWNALNLEDRRRSLRGHSYYAVSDETVQH